tara:strand:- start:508 stop:1257 length:750 start_codon:yes stop_codon:yes gene_type:complete
LENQPLISIITVVYNGVKTLEQTIQSVINQTYKNIEYIIIDGGSVDGTVDIIKKHEDQIALWISEPDKGLYDAMNKGISKAKGLLVGMINSDDWYEDNAVELIADAFQKHPDKQIFHGNRYDVLKNGTKSIRKFDSSELKFIYHGMVYNHPSMFVHKDIYEVNRYNVKLKSLSDYQLVLKIYLENKNLFLYINKCYVNYRLDGISSQLSLKEKLHEGFVSRKKAGLILSKNIISLIFRFLITIFYRIFK